MPALRFSCPACGSSLKAQSDHAGRKMPCPSCDSPVRVPDARRPESDGESEPAPAKRSSGSVVLHLITDVGSVAIWGLLILWVIWWLYVLASGLKSAQSAIQESSISAMCAAFMVGGYAIARAVEVMLGRLAAWSRR